MIPKYRVYITYNNLNTMYEVTSYDWSTGEFSVKIGEMFGCTASTPIGTDDLLESEEYTFMQSTGCFDKNDVEIFEGDIVEIKPSENSRPVGSYQVKKYKDYIALCLVGSEDNKLDIAPDICNKYTKVIGNIHEMPKWEV